MSDFTFQPMSFSTTKAEFNRAGRPPEVAQHTILVDLNKVLSLPTMIRNVSTTLSAKRILVLTTSPVFRIRRLLVIYLSTRQPNMGREYI